MEEPKNNIKELPNILVDLRELVFERIKNPFLASFSVIWVIFNWRIPFFLLASSKEVEERFEFVALNYSNICNTLLYPLIIALTYLYLKDIIFNLFEKTTNKFFIKRKETETEKTVKLIELEVKKIDALNKLKDAQEKNKLALSLEECKNRDKQSQFKISELTTEKENSEKRVDLLKETIEYDFQFDLMDKKIQSLLKEKKETDIYTLGIKLSQLLTEFEMYASKEIIQIIDELNKEKLGNFRLDSNQKLVDVELFSIGKFVLRYYIYSNQNLTPMKLNLTKQNIEN